MYAKKSWISLAAVLSIILAAICITAVIPPVLEAANQSGATTCLSNLRMLGMAVMMYAQDNDSCLPSVNLDGRNLMGVPDEKLLNETEIFCGHAAPWDSYSIDYINTNSPRKRLESYLVNKKVWKCPDDDNCNTECVVNSRWTSYHYRYYIAMAGASWGILRPFKISDFKYPANNIIFNEMEPFHDGRTATIPWLDKVGWAPDAKMNFAFLDGHVGSLPVSSLLAKDHDPRSNGWDSHWCKDVSTGEAKQWDLDNKDLVVK